MATGCYVPEDHYLPASYNGVAFFAMDVTSEHGRRIAVGEQPFSEFVPTADLGRRVRTFSISGEFRENNHVAQAAALIAAIELPGPGILVHPTRGILNVHCTSLRVRDNPEEAAGITQFDAEFTEAGDWLSGFSFGSSLLSLGIAAIVAAAFASFGERYRPRQARFYEVNQITGTTASAVSAIRNQFARVTLNSADEQTWRALSDFDQAISDPAALADPAKAAETLDLGIKAVAAYSTGQAKVDAMRALANWAAQPVRLTGVSGESIDALLATMRIVAAANMAVGAIESEPDTVGEALQTRDRIIAILESEEEMARARCDNNLYLALRNFHVEADTALLQWAYELPVLTEYNFNYGSHSLVAAYEIFGDAKRSREIEQRNPYLPWSMRPGVVAAI